ncbi:MAG: M23 family metallopeptidase [Phenylobacterium sp.]|nr:M23 family metallopeptidase [Phenylobacterium sp.]
MEQPLLAGAMMACAPSGDHARAAPAPSPEAAALASAAAAGSSADAATGLQLAFPVACTVGRDCEVQNYVDRGPGPGAKDYRCGSNTYEGHGGVDIRIPDMAAQHTGVAVLAAAAGRVARLRDGVADVSVTEIGHAALNGQDCGNGVVIDHGGGWETRYCHLAKGSLEVKVGDEVAVGQSLAAIGLSGATEYPHAHVTVRRNGKMVDPSAPNLPLGTCDPATSAGMWTPAAAQAMGYKAGVVLNAGFAGAPVSMEAIEAGGIAPATRNSPTLIAYVRAINLRGGDVQQITVVGPDGKTVAAGDQSPLGRAKAQYMMFRRQAL